ncbi:unnamed protein product [Lymnaea stagnalis]|uniref:Spaetzle domain-containing protein n=1 Tax=Lymnaea stagnalis TaxID=6523 RepID=A0AAV2HCX2_LYMST
MNPKDPDNPTTVGLIDRNQQKPGMGTAQTSSVARIWIVLTLVFLAVSIGLSGYIIYVKVFESQATTPGSKEYIRVTYPNYFKTPEEQKIFEEQYYRENTEVTAKPAEPDFNRTQLSSCFFTCSAYPTGNNSASQAFRRRRAAVRSPLMEWVTLYKTLHLMTRRDVNTSLSNPIYHGCCISRIFFTSPDTAIDVLGNNVTLTTIDNRRQYFPTQECKHAIGCTGCGCAQETGYYAAVVVNPLYPLSSGTQYVLDVIKIPGCCKCFNNRSPPTTSGK